MSAARTRLESLSADERVALHWHLDSGLSAGQIALRMDRSPEAVVQLILRGSRTLFGTRPWDDRAGRPDCSGQPPLNDDGPRR